MLLRAATSGRLPPETFERHLRDAERLADDKSYSATMTRANTLRHKDWHAWNTERGRMPPAWAECFTDSDVLACPTASSAARQHAHARARTDRTTVCPGQAAPHKR